MDTLAELESQVLQLPDDQRVALLHRILQASELSNDSYTQKFWDSEIIRRIDLLDSNQTQRIPASEVFRELDQKFA